jgi:murein DD-endopeptidase MepM/ murein hydrolase activator NlpD
MIDWAQLPRMAALAVFVLVTASLPATSLAQTQGEVDRAEDQLARAEAQKTDAYRRWDVARHQLDEASERFDDINRRREELSYTITRLETRLETADAEHDDLEARSRDVVVEAYMNHGKTQLASAFSASSIQEVLIVADLTEKATTRVGTDLNLLASVQRQNERLRSQLQEQEAEVRSLEAEAEALVDEMGELFEAAEAAYNAAGESVREAIDTVRRERAEFQAAEVRRKAASAAAARSSTIGAGSGLASGAIPGFVCPIQGGASFVNSWGWPRSGGTRSHKGTDMYGSQGHGHPLVAVQDGTVKLRTVSLGGIVVYLYDDAGNRYYYAHAAGYAAGLTDGQRVSRGQVIAYVGSTGNAGGPHLHFQIHPGGGAAVNPYPTVREAC